MPDIPKCGGLSECRKIANMAEIYSMPFAPHNVSSPIGTMASAHVCATVPNFLVLEFHWTQRDYWSTIIKEKRDIIRDGFIEMSDAPGIGLELDEEVARAHQYPGTTWFEAPMKASGAARPSTRAIAVEVFLFNLRLRSARRCKGGRETVACPRG
jgi:galactonate dehydratase